MGGVMTRPKAIPLLSAEWVNARIENVTDKALAIMDEIINQLMSSGYLPLEAPSDADFMKRLTPQQRTQFGLETPPEDEFLVP